MRDVYRGGNVLFTFSFYFPRNFLLGLQEEVESDDFSDTFYDDIGREDKLLEKDAQSFDLVAKAAPHKQEHDTKGADDAHQFRNTLAFASPHVLSDGILEAKQPAGFVEPSMFTGESGTERCRIVLCRLQ